MKTNAYAFTLQAAALEEPSHRYNAKVSQSQNVANQVRFPFSLYLLLKAWILREILGNSIIKSAFTRINFLGPYGTYTVFDDCTCYFRGRSLLNRRSLKAASYG